MERLFFILFTTLGLLIALAITIDRYQVRGLYWKKFEEAKTKGCNSKIISTAQLLNLYGVSLADIDLSNMDLSEASLINANLNKANLDGSTLTKADLTNASLIKASLKGASLMKASLMKASLKGGLFDRSQLKPG